MTQKTLKIIHFFVWFAVFGVVLDAVHEVLPPVILSTITVIIP